jgi:hypothetical protein
MEVGHRNRIPRVFHNILNIQSGQCPINSARKLSNGPHQYHHSGSNGIGIGHVGAPFEHVLPLHALKDNSTPPSKSEHPKSEEELREEERRFYCRKCEIHIANHSDIIQVGDIPVLSAQINPHGYVHEVITVHTIQNFSLFGPPEPADSWFPGYFWRYLICKGCIAHLGWSYHNTNQIEMVFAGLRIESIREK